MSGINEAWAALHEESDDSRRFYERERLAVWTMDMLAELMEQKGISRADVARKIGCSRSNVTQFFSGSKNPSLATVADLAWALGCRASISLEPLRSGAFISAPVCSVSKMLHVNNKRREIPAAPDEPVSEEVAEEFLSAAMGGA